MPSSNQPVSSRAGRTLVKVMAQCSPAAAAYGQCCVALGKDVAFGACAQEFAELRRCFANARKLK